jgi:hypothetical protein
MDDEIDETDDTLQLALLSSFDQIGPENVIGKNDDEEDTNLQLALLLSICENDLKHSQKKTTESKLVSFRKDLSDSAKQRLGERKLRESQEKNQEKSITDQVWNFFSMVDHKLIVDILSHICEFLPLATMVEFRLISHAFEKAIKSASQSETIYIESYLLPQLFRVNKYGKYDLMKTVWSNIHTLCFSCPPTYGTKTKPYFPPCSYQDSDQPSNGPNKIISPPNLTKIIIRAEYAYQLNFLVNYDLTNYNIWEVTVVINCCYCTPKCKICDFHLMLETISKINCKKHYIYHNNKLYSSHYSPYH